MRPERITMSKGSLSLIGIPKKFHSLTIDDFDTFGNSDLEKVKRYITDYLDNMQQVFESNEGLCLYGSNGVGKTFIACMIIKEAYRRRFTAKRVTFVEYVNLYTQLWGVKSYEEKTLLEEEFYNKYKAVEFLALEEVGKEIDSKIAAPILEDLFRYREDKGLVTIMCTNLAPKDLESRYGVSVSSLIKGNMTPIKIEGADMRRDYFRERVL